METEKTYLEKVEEYLIDEFHLGLLKLSSETIWSEIRHGKLSNDLDFFDYLHNEFRFVITYGDKPITLKSHLQYLNPSNEPRTMGGIVKILAEREMPVERQRVFLLNAIYLFLKNKLIKGENVKTALSTVREELHQNILTIFYYLEHTFETGKFIQIRNQLESLVEISDKVSYLINEMAKQLQTYGFEFEEVKDAHNQRLLFRQYALSNRFSQAFENWQTQRFFNIFHHEIERLICLQYLENLEHSATFVIDESIDNKEYMTPNKSRSKKVFVVHGHDELAKQTVARFLETIGLEAIILHEQSSRGRTIIEKLEHYTNVDFAVVLLTPDDVGARESDKENLKPRARQNVILELGYMMAKLGRNNICALLKDTVEKPTDYDGIVYVPMADNNDAWKLSLLKELKAAGIDGKFEKLYS